MNDSTEKALKAQPLSKREIYSYLRVNKIYLGIDMTAQAIVSDTSSYQSMSEEENSLEGMRNLLFSYMQRISSFAEMIHSHNCDLYGFNNDSINSYRDLKIDLIGTEFR